MKSNDIEGGFILPHKNNSSNINGLKKFWWWNDTMKQIDLSMACILLGILCAF